MLAALSSLAHPRRLFSKSTMSSMQHSTKKTTMMPDKHETFITWEQWEHSHSATRGCSKLLEEFEDEALPDYPCSYHVEDANCTSPNDSVPILSDSVDPIMSTVPVLSISESSSPTDDSSSYGSWRDADDIPTRPPSAFLQDFPPLVRCREDPAMGHPEDIIILDLDDDSMAHHWQQLWNTNGGEGIAAQQWSRSGSSPCQEVHECKEDENWPGTISNPVIEGESALVNWTTLAGAHTPEHLSHLI